MKIKKLFSGVLAILIICAAIPFAGNLVISGASKENGLIKGGGFETDDFWKSGRQKNDDAFEGEYVLAAGSKLSRSETVNVVNGGKYKLSFWYKNPSNDADDMFAVYNGTKKYSTISIDATEEWTYYETEITTKFEDLRLGIKGTDLYIDAVTITPENEVTIGLITNYSFEHGIDGWTEFGNKETKILGGGTNGFVHAQLANGDETGIYYDFAVSANSYYTLSFDYMGGGTDVAFGVAKARGTVDNLTMFTEKESIESVSEWTNVSRSFFSGSQSKLRIVFWSGNDGYFSLDNIRVVPDESKNLIKNGSFENGTDSWNGDITSVDEAAIDGEKSMKLPQKQYYKTWQTIDVTPNTSYTVSFYSKGSDWSIWAVHVGDYDGAPNVNSGEKGVLTSANLIASNPEIWTYQKVTVNSGDCNKLSLVFQSSSDTPGILIDGVYVCEKPHTAEDDLILANGGFEDKLNGWESSWIYDFDVSENAKSGKYSLSLKLNSYNKIWHKVNLTVGKSYAVYFNYTGACMWIKWSITSSDHTVEPGGDGYVVGDMLVGDYSTWQTAKSEVFVAQQSEYYINFMKNEVNGVEALIDDIYIVEVPEDQSIINGGFDAGSVAWDYSEQDAEIINDQLSGSSVLHLMDGYHGTVSQLISAEENTDYELSFKYKGVVPDNLSSWCISKDIGFSYKNVIYKDALSSSDEWQEYRTVFNSGSNNNLYIVFQNFQNTDLYIDDISITETDEKAQAYSYERPLYVGGLARNPYNDYPYITDENGNLISDFDFENDESQMIGENLKPTSETAYSGEKSLKFTADDAKLYSDTALTLKKNTRYYVTLYTKAINYSNGTYCSYGITDPDSGDFILTESPESEGGRALTADYQILPSSYDGEWHMQYFVFDTNDATTLNFTVKGKNATVYFDQVYIFEEKNAIAYKSPLETKEGATVISNNPDKKGVDESNNLFDNYTLDDFDTYWEDNNGTLYGTYLNAVNSLHSIQKNALYYNNPNKYPERIYYIKWVDVSPDTEYTFSAKYCITEPGDGCIGIINGYRAESTVTENQIFPTYIAKYGFSEENFDENCNWKTVSVSFNTKDRNRIGFVLLDKGGSAYVDDLRLFESSKGKVLIEPEDKFPKTIISNKYAVSGGKTESINSGVSLSDIVKTLDNRQYIRIFDANGNEIKSLSATAATGMQLRLMDGPTIKDRVNIVIRGDVNGDGSVNSSDITDVLKHITEEKALEGVYLAAADYDGDGKITVYDSLHSDNSPKSGSMSVAVSGPEKFNIGDKITVKVGGDKNGISAFCGQLSFSSKLTLESVVFADGNWLVSSVVSGNIIDFAAAKHPDGNSLSKTDSLITMTFTVGNISDYSEIYVDLGRLTASTDDTIFSEVSSSWKGKAYSKVTEVPHITEIEETQVVKAKNRLAVLKLDEADIEPDFDPEIKEYTATVPYKVDEVHVTAIAADEDATVTIGDTKLEYIGKNSVPVQVMSSDGLKRTYVITVTREKPTSSAVSDGIPVWVIIIICLSVALVIAFVITIIVIKKRKCPKDK